MIGSDMALPLTNEIKTKLAKYLCRSYDIRWSSSRTWDDIPEDARDEYLTQAEDLINAINDPSDDWKDPYWPIGFIEI